MLNSVYQLITPKTISVKHEDVDTKDQVIIRPEYLALCHADQRYYQGKRDIKILRKKLPMALIHEACGRVIHDPTGTFKVGQSVVMIPNIPGNREEKVIYENYGKGGGFLSSGHDGFMREFVNLPADRVVAFDDIDKRIAAITEFISVGMHAYLRFSLISHEYKNSIGIWGDGSLAFIVSSILKKKYPDTKIIVIVFALRRRLVRHHIFRQQCYQGLCRDSSGIVVVQPQDDSADLRMIGQILRERQRDAALRNFLFGTVHAGQGQQMLPVPPPAVELQQCGIGQ